MDITDRLNEALSGKWFCADDGTGFLFPKTIERVVDGDGDECVAVVTTLQDGEGSDVERLIFDDITFFASEDDCRAHCDGANHSAADIGADAASSEAFET